MRSRGLRSSIGRAIERACAGRTARSAGGSAGSSGSGSLEAYIRRSADCWSTAGRPTTTIRSRRRRPLSGREAARRSGASTALVAIERRALERTSARRTAPSRLTPSRRLPVYLNAIDAPAFAADAAQDALETAALAATVPPPREHGFAADKYWKYCDDHWAQTHAIAALPFLVRGGGLLRGRALRGRTLAARRRDADDPDRTAPAAPAGGRLHRPTSRRSSGPTAASAGTGRASPSPRTLVANRDNLTAEQVARIENQELRRVALERLGWQRFLETANAELRAQDDYGKLWSTQIRLDGERVQLVEVVNATAEPDGSYRRYFLRVPPRHRTAREAVAWTFGFDNAERVHPRRSIVTLMPQAMLRPALAASSPGETGQVVVPDGVTAAVAPMGLRLGAAEGNVAMRPDQMNEIPQGLIELYDHPVSDSIAEEPGCTTYQSTSKAVG